MMLIQVRISSLTDPDPQIKPTFTLQFVNVFSVCTVFSEGCNFILFKLARIMLLSYIFQFFS